MSQLESIDFPETLKRYPSAKANDVTPVPASRRPQYLLSKAWFANGMLPRETPLGVLTHAFNPGAALFLNELHYWLGKSKNYHGGRYWVYNPMDVWAQRIGYSTAGFRKIVKRLRTEGVLMTEKMNARKHWDQTLWYAIDYGQLTKLVITDLRKRHPEFDPTATNNSSEKAILIRPKVANDLPESTLEPMSKKLQQVGGQASSSNVVVSANACEEGLLVGAQLTEAARQLSPDCPALSKPTGRSSTRSEREKIFRAAADKIGQELPDSLKDEMNAKPVVVGQNAWAALREQLQTGTVRNPLGFLRNAVRNEWQPRHQTTTIPEDQNDWFKRARKNHLVAGATNDANGVWCAWGDTVPWTPVSELVVRYPLT